MNPVLKKALIFIGVLVLVLAVVGYFLLRGNQAEFTDAQLTGPDPVIAEADEETIPTMGLAEPIGWNDDAAPTPAEGLSVNRFAEGLTHPRTMLVLDNGDVLVAETNSQPREAKGITGFVMKHLMGRVGAGVPSPDRIVLLRDRDGDGVSDAKTELLGGLKSPFGMVVRNGRLIVANTDAVLSFPFEPGDTRIDGEPWQLMALPGGGNHWTRNLALDEEADKLYVSVGSASNIGEKGMDIEKGRAAIHEYDFAKQEARLFAAGLRNPTGLAINPDSRELWTTVNERDMLGPDGPVDYLTNVPVGAQYGWPWVYWKNIIDDRVEAPMPQFLTEYTRRPEYALGAHTAPLGLVFARNGGLGGKFINGAFVARHGSWNRKPLSGYDVVFVPFDGRGNTQGETPLPVLTGFIGNDGDDANGRPAMLAWDRTGALLVSDDTAGIIWRVSGEGRRRSSELATAR